MPKSHILISKHEQGCGASQENTERHCVYTVPCRTAGRSDASRQKQRNVRLHCPSVACQSNRLMLPEQMPSCLSMIIISLAALLCFHVTWRSAPAQRLPSWCFASKLLKIDVLLPPLLPVSNDASEGRRAEAKHRTLILVAQGSRVRPSGSNGDVCVEVWRAG